MSNHREDLDRLLFGKIPDVNRLIKSAGCDPFLRRMKGKCVDSFGGAPKSMNPLATGDVPKFDGTVSATRGQPLAVRREGEIKHGVGMFLERLDLLAGRWVPK